MFYNHFYWFFTRLWKQILLASMFRQLCLQNCKHTNGRLSWWQSFSDCLVFLILMNVSNKCCITIELILLKVIIAKNIYFTTTDWYFNNRLKLKIPFVMACVIWRCYILILVILLLSLLKVLFIVVVNPIQSFLRTTQVFSYHTVTLVSCLKKWIKDWQI